MATFFKPFQVKALGPVYTKRQRQYCDNSAMTLVILFTLKTMESLQNGVATHFQATESLVLTLMLGVNGHTTV